MTQSEKRQILIVDDEPEILKTLEHFIQKDEYELHLYTDPLKAFEMIEESKLDLIISDLKMPNLDGESLIKQIRNTEQNKDTHVLVISGHISQVVKDALTSTKNIHYMEKPVKNDLIVHKVSLIIAANDDSMTIDATLVNPVLNATIKTLSTMADVNPMPQKLHIKERSEISGDISGIVGISGNIFAGNLSISFPQSCFLEIVSRMLGTKETELTLDIRDAAGEIINVIFGQTKKVLNDDGFIINPAIPTIITGKSHTVNHPVGTPVIVLPFKTEFGTFKVEICGTRLTTDNKKQQ